MIGPHDVLAALWQRLGAGPYDALYRRGAPWERGGPRAELADLLASGRLGTAVTPGRRALDVGCGCGSDSRLLAQYGFDVTGVDFSAVAIEKARDAADRPGTSFVRADLFALPAQVTTQPFDLIFDGGTLDDFPSGARRRLAGILTGLARPGTVLLLWCFSAAPVQAPLFSLTGPSRLGGLGIAPQEISRLFGAGWSITRIPTAAAAPTAACYWMTRYDRPRPTPCPGRRSAAADRMCDDS